MYLGLFKIHYKFFKKQKQVFLLLSSYATFYCESYNIQKKKKHIFLPMKIRIKNLQKFIRINPIFFNISNWPKTSPNFHFCSTAWLMYDDFVCNALASNMEWKYLEKHVHIHIYMVQIRGLGVVIYMVCIQLKE